LNAIDIAEHAGGNPSEAAISTSTVRLMSPSGVRERAPMRSSRFALFGVAPGEIRVDEHGLVWLSG
jgi:methyl coenzyme M reductase subunit C